MEEKNPQEMTDQEILDEYDSKFTGARTYATVALYQAAAMRKHQLKDAYESRQEDRSISQGIRTRRVL